MPNPGAVRCQTHNDEWYEKPASRLGPPVGPAARAKVRACENGDGLHPLFLTWADCRQGYVTVGGDEQSSKVAASGRRIQSEVVRL